MSKPAIVQASLTRQIPLFLQTDSETELMAMTRDERERRRLLYLIQHVQLNAINLAILKKPTLTARGQRLLERLQENPEREQVEFEFVFSREPTAEDKADDLGAFLRDIPKFVACFLDTVLEGLADVGGVDGKIDTIRWMFRADEHLYIWPPPVNGVKAVLKQESLPFTWCCRVLGLDPETLREGVKESLNNQLQVVEKRIADGALKPMRREAAAAAVRCVIERST